MITAIVVDDEPIVRIDFAEMLKELDIEVVGTGKDGFDAIDLCRRYHPQLVLMDIKMPIFDGLESSRTILSEMPETCIVLITAFSDTDYIEEAKEIGVAGYIVKPIDERSLKPALEIALSQHRRYNKAVNDVHKMEKKLVQKNNIDRAKLILSKKEKISEGEAYSRIQKMSMDKRCSMEAIAEELIRMEKVNRQILDCAKSILMKKYQLSDVKAYEKIKNQSIKWNCSIYAAAAKMIKLMES